MLKVVFLGLCLAIATATPVTTIEKIENEITCNLCTTFIQGLQEALNSKQHQVKVKDRLLSLCDKSSNEEKTVCQDVVRSFSDEAMDVMAAEMKPQKLCGLLQVCEIKKEVTLFKNIKAVINLKPRNNVQGPACSFCELVVQTVDKYIENNRTDAAINATLYKVCNKLPEGLKELCLSYIPKFIEVIAEGLDPKEACTKIKLCTSKLEKKTTVEKTPVHNTGVEECDVCKFVVQLLDSLIGENRTREAVNATLFKICASFPPYIKETCDLFAPNLAKVLTEEFDPERACGKIDLCQAQKQTGESKLSSESSTKNTNQENTGGEFCSLCELVVQTVDKYIENNKTEAAINATLYKICNKLPAGIKEVCLSFIPELVKALADGLDPKQACTKIGACKGQDKVNIEQTREQPEEQTEATREQPQEEAREQPVQNKEKANGEFCSLCELVVQTVDKYIENNKTEAAINSTLYKICNKLPAGIKEVCLSFIPELVKVLADGLDPKQACTKIGACKGKVINKLQEEPELEEKPVPVISKNKANGEFCSLCELVVQTVDKYIENNKTEAAINATLYKICNKLPAGIKEVCLSFIPELVKVLADGLDPKQACTKIGACSSAQSAEIKKTVDILSKKDDLKANGGEFCSLCELVVQTVDKYIENNKTEAAINATLYKVCNKLPAGIKEVCLSFIPELVKALADGLDPKQACTKIGACKAQSAELKKTVEALTKKAKVETGGEFCSLCELVVQTVDKYIENNKTEAAINATLYKICNKLPAGLKEVCLSFIPELVKVLADGLDPKQACTKIGMCSSNTTHSADLTKKIEILPKKINLEDDLCSLCEFVVQTLDQYIQNNKSEAAINATLYKLCKRLPDPFKTTCLAFAPQLVKVLHENIDPEKACAKIKLCDQEQKTAAKSVTKQEDKKSKVGETSCEFCKLIVDELDHYLQDNRSSAAINATFDKICNSFPAKLKALCKQYEGELIKVLEGGIDAVKACSDIHVCADDNNNISKPRYASCNICKTEMKFLFPEDYSKWCPSDCEQTKELIVDSKNAANVVIKDNANPTECAVCKFVVELVDNILKDNHSEAAINATLYKVCDSLPAAVKVICLTYLPALEKALKNGVSPEKACEEVHACTNTTLIDIGKITRHFPKPDFNKIPKPSLFKLSKLKLPQLNKPSILRKLSKRSTLKFSFQEVKCDLCKDIVSALDKDVYKDEDKVKKGLDDICDRFPSPVNTQCHQAIDPNWKSLWNNIFKNIASPQNLCELLTFCPKQ